MSKETTKTARKTRSLYGLVGPTITVRHDGKTSNYDALEAVRELMIKNYHERTRKNAREVLCKSGRRLRVTELKKPDDNTFTSCRFRVETL